jgi:CRISPR-associated endoribonuclease Cas6
MISTPDILIPNATQIAGLALVLRTVPPSNSAIPLPEWLDGNESIPFWIPLASQQGITKVMPVLPCADKYPQLFQSICQQLAQFKPIEWQGRHYEIGGVETQTDRLFVIQLSLSHLQPLPATLNRAMHGMCLQWFANADPKLAEQLHQSSSAPFTISARPRNRQQIQIRITLLQQELLAPLLWGLYSHLGQEIFITEVACQISPHVQILTSNSYEKLAQVPSQSRLELEFQTPTSFKQQNIIQPFPLPELVFGGLLRRWNTFAPEEIKFDRAEWQGMIAQYDLKTQSLKMKADEIGSIGWIKYEFPNPEQARIATILIHFAEYAGVGRKTAMGMGQTHLKSH